MRVVIVLFCLVVSALAAEEKIEESEVPAPEHNVSKRSADYGYGSHHYEDDHDYTFGYDFYPSYRQQYRPVSTWYPQPQYGSSSYRSYNYVTYPNQYSKYRPLYEDYGHFLYSAHHDDQDDYGYDSGHHGYVRPVYRRYRRSA